MSKTAQIIEDMPLEQQAAYRTVRAEAMQQLFFNTAVWLGITVLFGVMLAWLSASDIIVGVCGVWLLMMLVLLLRLKSVEKKQIANVQQSPELMPFGMTPEEFAVLAEQDNLYYQERTKLRHERTTLLIGSFFVFPLMPLFLIIAIIRAKTAKQTPGTLLCLLQVQISQTVQLLLNAAVLIWLLLAIGTFYVSARQFTSNARVNSMNGMAHTLCNAVVTYQTDLDEEGENSALKTTILPPYQSAEPGSLEWGIHQYFSDSERNWCAIICDQEGNVTAALICKNQITESDLRPWTLEEQREQARHTNCIIGYYEVPNRRNN